MAHSFIPKHLILQQRSKVPGWSNCFKVQPLSPTNLQRSHTAAPGFLPAEEILRPLQPLIPGSLPKHYPLLPQHNLSNGFCLHRSLAPARKDLSRKAAWLWIAGSLLSKRPESLEGLLRNGIKNGFDTACRWPVAHGLMSLMCFWSLFIYINGKWPSRCPGTLPHRSCTTISVYGQGEAY